MHSYNGLIFDPVQRPLDRDTVAVHQIRILASDDGDPAFTSEGNDLQLDDTECLEIIVLLKGEENLLSSDIMNQSWVYCVLHNTIF